MNEDKPFPGPKRPDPAGDFAAPQTDGPSPFSWSNRDAQSESSIPRDTTSAYTAFKAEFEAEEASNSPHDVGNPFVPPTAVATAPAKSRIPRSMRAGRSTRHKERSVGSRSNSQAGRIILYAVLAVVGIGFFVVSNSSNSPLSGAGIGNDRSYSYYEDRTYDSSIGSRWDTDNTFGADNNWDYDGPHQYGKYGSAQIKANKSNKGADPTLESGVNADPDVFAQYLAGGASVADRFDPTGGQPVGPGSLNYGNMGYNPYSDFYSNPYLNRLQLRFGQGYGRGALKK